MSTPSCTGDLYNGLLTQNLTGSGGPSYYACGFLSNYTLAQKCCKAEPVHRFSDPCYSWCDLPASLNDEIDTDESFDMLGYMGGCLNSTGETIGPLWCRLTGAHVIEATTTAAAATVASSTFDVGAYCATADAQVAISVNDPKPACGILPNAENAENLVACCQPAPAKWSVMHCYEYCYLPTGIEFRGLGNLTYDEALGSFKACLMEKGKVNGSTGDAALEGVLCRVNGSEIDLRSTTFGTTKYLTGGGVRVKMVGIGVAVVGLVLGVMVAI